ncbi:MAG: hypothetical protein ACK5Z5_03760 [Neisseriaceae bacterium]
MNNINNIRSFTPQTPFIPEDFHEDKSKSNLFVNPDPQLTNNIISMTITTDVSKIKEPDIIIRELIANIDDEKIESFTCENFLSKFNELDRTNQDNFMNYCKGSVGVKRIKAMLYLGHIYNYVESFKNTPEAKKSYQFAQRQGLAIYELGEIYEAHGQLDKAITHYYQLGLNKNVDAIYRLGILCKCNDSNNDAMVPESNSSKVEQITAWLEKFYLNFSQTDIRYSETHFSKNSLLWMEVALKLTQNLSCINNLGVAYIHRSNGVQKGIELLEYAASKGGYSANVNLVNFYRTKDEIKDLQKAIYWAQNLGNMGLCTIGNIYSSESSIKNISLAISYYARSINQIKLLTSSGQNLNEVLKQQLSIAYKELGYIYLNQKSIQNPEKAIKLFRESCKYIDSSRFKYKEYPEIYVTMHAAIVNEAIAKGTEIGKQFGEMITMLKIFAGIEAVIDFISGKNLNICVGNNRFLLSMLENKCRDILHYPSYSDNLINMGRKFLDSSTKLSDVKYDDSPYLKEGIISEKLNDIIFNGISYEICRHTRGSIDHIDFLFKYYDCYIDLENLDLPILTISSYTDVLIRESSSEVDITKINFKGCNSLCNLTLNSVYLDLNQLELFSKQNTTLNSFTVSYNSVYGYLYQSYKLLFCIDSKFNILNDDLKKVQLVAILNEIIYDVESKGGKIERLNEIKEWVNNIMK